MGVLIILIRALSLNLPFLVGMNLHYNRLSSIRPIRRNAQNVRGRPLSALPRTKSASGLLLKLHLAVLLAIR